MVKTLTLGNRQRPKTCQTGRFLRSHALGFKKSLFLHPSWKCAVFADHRKWEEEGQDLKGMGSRGSNSGVTFIRSKVG